VTCSPWSGATVAMISQSATSREGGNRLDLHA
jgi:hypothetical protein